MSSAQKIIKYFGFALAFVLVAFIINLLFKSSLIVGGLFNDNVNSSFKEILSLQDNISELNIELDFSSLEIKVGDTFKVETNSDDIKVINEKQKIKIIDNNILSFNKNNTRKVIIYFVKDARYSVVNIKSGVGNIDIDILNSKKITLDLGIGNIFINDIHADSAIIDAGIGNFNIEKGIINNLDFDLGIGKTDIKAKLTGTNSLDAGIGKLNLELAGSDEDYKLNFEKGIGKITFNNNSIHDGAILGSGFNIITIDGGIGKVNVTTQNN